MESYDLLESLLVQMREVDSIFEKNNTEKRSYSEICEILSGIMNANVYIFSKKGKVLGTHFQNEEDSMVASEPDSNDEHIAEEKNQDLIKINETIVCENCPNSNGQRSEKMSDNSDESAKLKKMQEAI